MRKHNYTRAVYEYLRDQGGTADKRDLLKIAGDSRRLNSCLSNLYDKHGVQVIRLNDDRQPLPKHLSKIAKGRATAYYRIEAAQEPVFRTEAIPDKRTSGARERKIEAAEIVQVYLQGEITKTQAVYEYIRVHGGEVSAANLRKHFNEPQYPVSSALKTLKKVRQITIERIDREGNLVPETGLSSPQIGMRTQTIRLQENGQSQEEKTIKSDVDINKLLAQIRNDGDTFRTPCFLPLEQHTICYHGPKCANAKNCPIAVKLPWYQKYDDTRVKARQRIEKAGWSLGWRFTIRDVFGRESKATTKNTNNREEKGHKK